MEWLHLARLRQTAGPDTNVEGGSAAFGYLWEHIETDSGTTPSISSATAQNPTWTATVDDSQIAVSHWRVTVTDAQGQMASATAQVTLSWFNASGL